MPTPTYELIETTTLASTASSVTFSSITQDYRDLVLVADGESTATQTVLALRLNSDSGNNYSRVNAFGENTDERSFSATGESSAHIAIWESGVSNAIVQIMDYSATDKHKTILSRGNSVSRYVMMYADRYASTSALTSVEVITLSNALASGTTLTLYGIAA